MMLLTIHSFLAPPQSKNLLPSTLYITLFSIVIFYTKTVYLTTECALHVQYIKAVFGVSVCVCIQVY